MSCCADRKSEVEIWADPMAEILLESTAALAACGKVDHACRLAGRAYVALRRTIPRWRAASTSSCAG